MDTPNTQPTIMQRLEADSPLFFKKAELLGLSLIALAAAITQVPFIPPYVAIIVGSIGATMKVISMFAVKDVTSITNPNASLQDYVNLANDLKAQLDEVKNTVKNTVEQVQSTAAKNKPADEVPVIKTVPVTVQNALEKVTELEASVATESTTI